MIRISVNTLLLIILVVILIAILIVLIRISYQLRKRQEQSSQNALFDYLKFQHTNTGSSQANVQSNFFKKSMMHAENVIRGIINADDYTKEDKQGSDIIRSFMYLGDDEKNKLLTSLNYYQSDPMIYSESEKEFRKISAQKQIPLWIVILQGAMNKLQASDPSSVLKVA